MRPLNRIRSNTPKYHLSWTSAGMPLRLAYRHMPDRRREPLAILPQVSLVVSTNCRSAGEALRVIDQKDIIKADFVLVRVFNTAAKVPSSLSGRSLRHHTPYPFRNLKLVLQSYTKLLRQRSHRHRHRTEVSCE